MNQSRHNRESGKAQVTLLAGFLGAGKTTLLKRILSWEADLTGTVVIVNEFGAVGIDGDMVKGDASDMVEFNSGCVCCVLKAEFNAGLKKIWEELKPKRVLIEASGVAEPGAITEIFREKGIVEHMEVRKVVTVLDADYWDAREHFGPLFYHQLEGADLLLLNKIDLIGEENVPQVLSEIHEAMPNCQVIPTRFCAVDPETLWSVDLHKDFGMKPGEFFEDDHHEHSSHEHDRYIPFYFENPRPLNEECFRKFADNLPWEVFRMKGPVRFHSGTRMINFVGGKAEWTAWDGAEGTRLAFVGLGVHPERFVESLKRCVSE